MNTSDTPVAVVTGGARGIGLATAGALVAAGYRVVIADRDDPDPDGAEEAAAVAAATASARVREIEVMEGFLSFCDRRDDRELL